MKSDAIAVSPEEVATRAATVDELLSDDFESLPGRSATTTWRRNALLHGVTRVAVAIGNCSSDG